MGLHILYVHIDYIIINKYTSFRFRNIFKKIFFD